MPKSKKTKAATKPTNTKAKDTTTAAKAVTSPSNPSTGGGGEELSTVAKTSPSKPYKTSKAPGLTNKQKAALAHHVMVRVGDLMEMDDAKLSSEDSWASTVN